ncbi:MAG: thiamine-phosphate kinase [Candidatus Omnitrophota bacterium]
MKLLRLGEFGLIKRIKETVGRMPHAVEGIGDDAAVLPWTEKEDLLFTTDMILEDVHFTLKGATPFDIGWKALGVNLSDIAAMGGLPLYAVVALGAPVKLPVTFYDHLIWGMKVLGQRFDTLIVGGDTDRSEKLIVSIALLGKVERQNAVLRSGSRVGDILCVTGTLGGSRKGKHLSFIPRLLEARCLVKHFRPSAMIDVSDGVASDVRRICEESGVGALVEGSAIPLSKGVTVKEALTDGEDFELLFTLPPQKASRLLRKKELLKCPVTAIGKIVPQKSGIHLRTAKGTVSLKEPIHHF